MLFNKKIKWFFLICLCIIFAAFVSFLAYYEYSNLAKEVDKKEISVEEIEASLTNQGIANFGITLGDSDGFYNSRENTYYFLIDEKNADTFLDSKLKINARGFKYSILNDKYYEQEKFYVDFENSYDLLIYNDMEFCRTKIQFTCLPIINIGVAEEPVIADDAKSAEIRVYSKDYNTGKGTKSQTTESIIYVRGGISTVFNKKQFRLKLRKGDEYNELSLLGMDADEDWILDAMYADYSKIRTKLSYDIWNEMNSHTVNTFDNDIEMEYVDVYVNEEYRGVYLLKEFLDWKKLGLNKTTDGDSGVLIKGMQYADFEWEKYDRRKLTSAVWPYEMKYPKNQEDYSKYWDTIIPKIYTHFFEPEKVTEEYVLDNFYVHNYNDYKLLINFIYAADNFEEKNAYASLSNLNEDTKVLLTPWDLDMTYGYYWSNDSITFMYEEPELVNDTRNLWIGSEYVDGLLKDRYWELRESVFNMDYLNEKIDSYYNKIKYTVKKDSQRWLPTDLEAEITKIKDWLKERIEVLDKEFER